MEPTSPNQLVPSVLVEPLAVQAPAIMSPELIDATPEMVRKAEELALKLDLKSSQGIQVFGVDAQKRLTAQSESMLRNVRNSDTGKAGETLSELMLQFKGLKVNELSAEKNPLQKAFFLFASPLAKFQQRFETVSAQINETIHKLEGDRMALSRDVVGLEGLFAATLEQYRDLTVYIIAAEKALTRWRQELVPALQQKAELSASMLDAQEARDGQNTCNELERRINNLRLTKTATLQSLPQIRLIQDINKSLVDKIQTSIVTTIPIWKQQVAMAMTLFRQRKAMDHEKAVADTTNRLLKENAELLQHQNATAREQIERGVIDIDTLKHVNDSLIQTIEDTIRISEEAKEKRISAAHEMIRMETTLKSALLTASNR